MNVLRYLTVHFALIIFISPCLIYTYSFSEYNNETNTQDLLETLCSPISCTPQGFNHFLKNTYNHTEYGLTVLPNNFNHLVQFLEHGKKTEQNRAYTKSILKLFHNKIKAGDYINSFAFSDLLEKLPALLKGPVTHNNGSLWQQLKLKVNDLLYNTFLSRFSFFKKNPTSFFETLSDEILEALEKEGYDTENEVTPEQLRKSIVCFLELNINRLIWSPEDKEQTWHMVKKIAQQLDNLMEEDIITDLDDLDNLYWSLIHRYSFFLTLTESKLEPETFAYVRTDIESNESVLFDIEEQEEFITSKKSHILQVLLENEARSLARERGVFLKSC